MGCVDEGYSGAVCAGAIEKAKRARKRGATPALVWQPEEELSGGLCAGCGEAGVQSGCLDCQLGNQLVSLRERVYELDGWSGKQKRLRKKALKSLLADLGPAVSGRQNLELAALMAELELAISPG